MGRVGEPLLMKRLPVEWRPQRLPTATFFSLDESKIAWGTRASWKRYRPRRAARAARTVRKVGCTRPGADEMDGSAHCTSPAATVWFVASSIRMKQPVARTSS